MLIILFPILVFMFFMPAASMADPFLTCDPPTYADGTPADTDDIKYVVEVVGQDPVTVPIDQSRGTLWYDMGDTPDGDHEVRVRAKNLWSMSEPASFFFSKQRLSTATSVVITSE
ncbi:MAG: hypothetical protein CSA23_04950 [Deltaproteobacteria bacterium]|nr:MAG: hypothetical protein CSA23_04950 [Deltaproteobacteria bacterium]